MEVHPVSYPEPSQAILRFAAGVQQYCCQKPSPEDQARAAEQISSALQRQTELGNRAPLPPGKCTVQTEASSNHVNALRQRLICQPVQPQQHCDLTNRVTYSQ